MGSSTPRRSIIRHRHSLPLMSLAVSRVDVEEIGLHGVVAGLAGEMMIVGGAKWVHRAGQSQAAELYGGCHVDPQAAVNGRQQDVPARLQRQVHEAAVDDLQLAGSRQQPRAVRMVVVAANDRRYNALGRIDDQIGMSAGVEDDVVGDLRVLHSPYADAHAGNAGGIVAAVGFDYVAVDVEIRRGMRLPVAASDHDGLGLGAHAALVVKGLDEPADGVVARLALAVGRAQ